MHASASAQLTFLLDTLQELAPRAEQELSSWGDRLAMYVYETVGRKRIAQFFDIVVDHPDSLPAIQDLQQCLGHTKLHASFALHFRRAMQERLLHAGERLC